MPDPFRDSGDYSIQLESHRLTTAINSLSLLRLPDVLQRVPVSRATWWAGVKSGKFPASVKLGPRTTCWRSVDIDKLIASLSPETK
ncbi:AlpA family phage regulatory protein [Diaphorobacter sp.]|uniref:helix-turn-helix transcriptional regulator n=1 Tax=Diaphorobacter sp. TaxID=1934310 RepID=UPI0028A8173D|nr:AlpA family phage regulatory protein [Diaphorobacter sp.]